MRTLSTFSKTMAQVMKSRMAFHGINQSEMAKSIDISQSQLSKILRGDRTIDLDTFAAFCETIGESPTALIKEGEQFAEKIKSANPNLYINAAKEHLVSLDTSLAANNFVDTQDVDVFIPQSPSPAVNDDVPLTADGEVDYTELTRRFNPEELGMAAHRDENKYLEMNTPEE